MSGGSRSYQWQDPRPVWAQSRDLPGLEILRREIAGMLPPSPISVALRLELREVSEGKAVFAGAPGEDHYNAVGGVQGGWTTSLLDAAIGSAVFTTLPAGVGYTTLELKVNFTRGITVETGVLTALGQVVHGGRRVATAEGRVFDRRDKLYAHATATCLIQPKDR